MSLLVWLPLNGDLENKGCSNAVATAVTTAGYSDGKLGKALSSGKIKIDAKYVPNIFNNTAMSICFWYNNNGTTSSHPICGFSGNNGDGDSGAVRSWDFFNYSTVNNFHWSMGTLGNGILSNVIPNNTWVHFCITFKTGSLKIYINGEQSYSSTSSTSSFTFDKSYYISFGYTQMLNDFRIYDECLSKEQIHQISQGLILHYPLNSGYGNENLLVNSYNGCNVSYTSSTILDETYYGFKIRYLKYEGTSYQDTIQVLNVVTPKPDSYYTASFWAKGNCIINNYFFPNTCISGISSDGHTTTSVDGNCYISLTPEWKRYWITWKTRSDVSGAKNIVVGRIQNKGTGAECYIAGLKFEEGDKNSVWSPNPADALYKTLGYDSTTAYDTSGFGNDGTMVNNIVHTSDTPLYDSSINLQKANSNYINLQNTYITNQSTINFWGKVNTFGGWQRFFEFCNVLQGQTGNHRILLGTSGNTQQLGLHIYGGETGTTSLYVNSNITTIDTNWHMYSIVFNKTNLKVFMDGKSIVDTTMTQELTNMVRQYSYIGKSSYSADSYFDGNISDFRIYSTALSAEDIKQLYQTKAKIDKNGILYCSQFIDNDYEKELLTTQKMTFNQATSQGTITYETNGNEIINIITMDNTISSWKYLFNNAFDKTKIINHKLKLSFKYKTNVSTAYSMAVKMCKGDSTKPQTINIGSITLSTNWQEYNGIITFGNTYDNQGIYIHTGNFCGGNLYIKDLSLKIYENNNKTDFTKKSQIITGELSELDSNKTYVYKNSKIVTNQIIEN